jgi:hypothetical protein
MPGKTGQSFLDPSGLREAIALETRGGFSLRSDGYGERLPVDPDLFRLNALCIHGEPRPRQGRDLREDQPSCQATGGRARGHSQPTNSTAQP